MSGFCAEAEQTYLMKLIKMRLLICSTETCLGGIDSAAHGVKGAIMSCG